VTYAKMQNVASNNRVLGRVSGAAGDVEELTGTQVTTLLDVFGALKGLVPANGGATTTFLRADGTWQAPAGTGHAIYNDAALLAQRASLKFQNGITASDADPFTLAKLGGVLIENTAFTGAFNISFGNKNVGFFSSTPDFEEGDKIMFIGVCTTPPTTPPTSGVFVYVQLINGVYELKIMDSGGNIKGLS
jgi:hypothetical protein